MPVGTGRTSSCFNNTTINLFKWQQFLRAGTPVLWFVHQRHASSNICWLNATLHSRWAASLCSYLTKWLAHWVAHLAVYPSQWVMMALSGGLIEWTRHWKAISQSSQFSDWPTHWVATTEELLDTVAFSQSGHLTEQLWQRGGPVVNGRRAYSTVNLYIFFIIFIFNLPNKADSFNLCICTCFSQAPGGQRSPWGPQSMARGREGGGNTTYPADTERLQCLGIPHPNNYYILS